MNLRLFGFSNLGSRERLLAIGSIVALLVVGLDRWVIMPWTRHGRMVRQEIKHMEKELQAHQRLLARREEVFAQRNHYRSYLKPALADDRQMASLLKEVEYLAHESRVQVGEIKPLAVESDESDESGKRYPLEVRFACTLEEWVDFVYHLEISPSLYEITRLGLSTHEETQDRLDGYLRLVSVSMHRLASHELVDTVDRGQRDERVQ